MRRNVDMPRKLMLTDVTIGLACFAVKHDPASAQEYKIIALK
jgi:hypothetical protein